MADQTHLDVGLALLRYAAPSHVVSPDGAVFAAVPPAPEPAKAKPEEAATEEQEEPTEEARLDSIRAKLSRLRVDIDRAASGERASSAAALDQIRASATRKAQLDFQNELHRAHRKRVLKQLRKGG